MSIVAVVRLLRAGGQYGWELLEELLKNPLAIYSLATALVAATLFFALQLFRVGPDIRRLNKIETIAQLAHFCRRTKADDYSLRRSDGYLKRNEGSCKQRLKDLESLKEFVTDLQIKMSEVQCRQNHSNQIGRGRGTTQGSPVAAHAAPLPPEQLFQSMKNEWAIFIDAFRRRLNEAGIPPQMNRIGKMTLHVDGSAS